MITLLLINSYLNMKGVR